MMDINKTVDEFIRANMHMWFDTGDRDSGPYWISGCYSDGYYARAGDVMAGPFREKAEAARWVVAVLEKL